MIEFLAAFFITFAVSVFAAIFVLRLRTVMADFDEEMSILIDSHHKQWFETVRWNRKTRISAYPTPRSWISNYQPFKEEQNKLLAELFMIKRKWIIRHFFCLSTDHLFSDRAKFYLGIHHHYKPAVSLVMFKRKPFKSFTVRVDRKTNTHLPKTFRYVGTLDDVDQVDKDVLSIRFQHEGISYYGTFTPSSRTWR